MKEIWDQGRPRSRNSKASKGVYALGGLAIALVIIALIAYPFMLRSTMETVTITVVDKERVHTEDGSHYRVYTESEVFTNEDSLMFAKFNSADLQGRLREGETYTVEVVGWRVQFLSQFRNIIRIASGNR